MTPPALIDSNHPLIVLQLVIIGAMPGFFDRPDWPGSTKRNLLDHMDSILTSNVRGGRDPEDFEKHSHQMESESSGGSFMDKLSTKSKILLGVLGLIILIFLGALVGKAFLSHSFLPSEPPKSLHSVAAEPITKDVEQKVSEPSTSVKAVSSVPSQVEPSMVTPLPTPLPFLLRAKQSMRIWLPIAVVFLVVVTVAVILAAFYFSHGQQAVEQPLSPEESTPIVPFDPKPPITDEELPSDDSSDVDYMPYIIGSCVLAVVVIFGVLLGVVKPWKNDKMKNLFSCSGSSDGPKRAGGKDEISRAELDRLITNYERMVKERSDIEFRPFGYMQYVNIEDVVGPLDKLTPESDLKYQKLDIPEKDSNWYLDVFCQKLNEGNEGVARIFALWGLQSRNFLPNFMQFEKFIIFSMPLKSAGFVGSSSVPREDLSFLGHRLTKDIRNHWLKLATGEKESLSANYIASRFLVPSPADKVVADGKRWASNVASNVSQSISSLLPFSL